MRLLAPQVIMAAAVMALPATAQDAPRLTLDQARTYMLERINRDRTSAGLAPVKMDPVAALAGQRHAAEMATEVYLAHWDRAGKLPPQRYTEVGGTDFVQENVYIELSFKGKSPARPVEAVAEPTFTTAELDEIESTFMSEVAPADGHRRNILAPEHTHVGIALARGQSARTSTVACAQEFVNRYARLESLPGTVTSGSSLLVSGTIAPGCSLYAVGVASEPTPVAMSAEELMASGSYSMPRPIRFYAPPPGADGVVNVRSDGSFRVSLGTEPGRTGLVHVIVWASGADGRHFPVSHRTLVVR